MNIPRKHYSTSAAKRETRFAMATIIAGALLRLLFLSKNDLWYDESCIIFLGENLSQIHNPHLYFNLMNLWTRIFGNSEFFIRVPSVIFSAAGLIFTYLICKRMFPEGKTTLLATTITALSPFQIWYAQEARHYAGSLFFSVMSSYFLLLALEKQSRKNTLLYILSSVLAILISYYSALIFISQALFVILMTPKKSKEKILLAAVPSVMVIPLIPTFMKQLASVKAGFWLPAPSAKILSATQGNFILGFSGTPAGYFISGLLVKICVIFIIVKLFTIKDIRLKSGLAFCLILSILPRVAAYIVSRLYIPVYIDRGLIVCTPYFYILLSWAVCNFKPRFLRYLTIAIIILSLTIADTRYFLNIMHLPASLTRHVGVHPKRPVKPLAKFLLNNLAKGDFLIIGHMGITYPLAYYMGLRKNNISQFPFSTFFVFDDYAYHPVANRPYSSMRMDEKVSASYSQFSRIYQKSPGRIYYVAGNWARDGSLDSNSAVMKERLDSSFGRSEEKEFDGIKLFIYNNEGNTQRTQRDH